MLQRVANQKLTGSSPVQQQPVITTLEGPIYKMSPPTNDSPNGLVDQTPGDLAPVTRIPPATTAPELQAQQTPLTQKRTPKDFIFGKVIGEGSFSTVSLNQIFIFDQFFNYFTLLF